MRPHDSFPHRSNGKKALTAVRYTSSFGHISPIAERLLHTEFDLMPRPAPPLPMLKPGPALRRLWLCVSLLSGAAGLGACATNIGDAIPAGIGGLPAEAPARPAEQAAYPAVHDIPPPRPVSILNDDQQEKLEKDLTTARDRQEARNPNAKKPAAGAKPKP